MGFNRPLPPEGRALLPRVSTPPIRTFGANFSPCRTWRYKLSRRWSPAGPMIAFVGLNPSTADEVNAETAGEPPPAYHFTALASPAAGDLAGCIC